MKPPVVFNAASYLVPFGFGALIIGLILGWQIGFWIVVIIGVILYQLLVFVNSVDREIIEIAKRKKP